MGWAAARPDVDLLYRQAIKASFEKREGNASGNDCRRANGCENGWMPHRRYSRTPLITATCGLAAIAGKRLTGWGSARETWAPGAKRIGPIAVLSVE